MNKTKLRRKQLTVSDLLTQDDVKTTIDTVIKDKAEITDLICIYQDKEGFINYHWSKNTTLDRRILLLEQVKFWMLKDDEDD
jgi:quinol monooxygenase YgiN